MSVRPTRLLLLWLLSCAAPLHARQTDPYIWPLENLRQPSQQASIAQHSAPLTVAVLFQPDCPWCEKQIRELHALTTPCPTQVQALLIGMRGEAAELKQELQRYPQLPALRADTRFLRRIAAGDATPVLLFFDATGQLLAQRQGYLPESRLREILAVATDKQCASPGGSKTST